MRIIFPQPPDGRGTTLPHTLSVRCPGAEALLGVPALLPIRLVGHEAVNSLFEYDLLLETPDRPSRNCLGERTLQAAVSTLRIYFEADYLCQIMKIQKIGIAQSQILEPRWTSLKLTDHYTRSMGIISRERPSPPIRTVK